jgi:succinate dehydrogenase / fumarate reductase iron-sulfur subunit
MNCIMCGACVSDCTVLEAELKRGVPVEKTWLAPAALAKAYRFVGDPRDDHQYDRLEKLSDSGGIWDCTHCFECIEVCPKGVAPMDRIMALRDKAVSAGITNNNGTRHAKAFHDSVKAYGRLDEVTLVPKSVGFFNIRELLPQMPTGLRMLKAGKLRPPHKAENRKKIKKIVDALDKEQME